VPHPQIRERLQILANEIIEAGHLRVQLVQGWQGTAGFEREGDAVPKLPNARDGLKSDVELKFAPSSMMKRELFGG